LTGGIALILIAIALALATDRADRARLNRFAAAEPFRRRLNRHYIRDNGLGRLCLRIMVGVEVGAKGMK
jgi:hypothetical protein